MICLTKRKRVHIPEDWYDVVHLVCLHLMTLITALKKLLFMAIPYPLLLPLSLQSSGIIRDFDYQKYTIYGEVQFLLRGSGPILFVIDTHFCCILVVLLLVLSNFCTMLVILVHWFTCTAQCYSLLTNVMMHIYLLDMSISICFMLFMEIFRLLLCLTVRKMEEIFKYVSFKVLRFITHYKSHLFLSRGVLCRILSLVLA